MGSDERITSLLGAGAVLDLRAPTTAELTQITQDHLDKKIKELLNTSSILKLLTGDVLKPDKTFEDVLAALEILYSLGERADAENGDLNSSTDAGCEFYTNPDKVKDNAITIIDAIQKEILRYDKTFISLQDEGKESFVKFWEDLCRNDNVDIVTLNYDTCIEQVLKGKRIPFADGFTEPFEDCLDQITMTQYYHDHSMFAQIFHPEYILNQSEKNLVMHLHGCVYYGYGSFAEKDKKHEAELNENEYALKSIWTCMTCQKRMICLR